MASNSQHKQQPQLKKENSLHDKLSTLMTNINEDGVIKRLGTFPKSNQPTTQLNKQQDILPTSVTFNLYDPEPLSKDTKKADKQSKTTTSKQSLQSQTQNTGSTKQTDSRISQKKEFLFQGQGNSQNSSMNSFSAFTTNTYFSNEPNANSIKTSQNDQAKQPCKYEFMAQNLNLESLIKQAQQRNNSSGEGTLKLGVQSNFMNKIDNFEGDNDHVDDEQDSSNDGSNHQQSHKEWEQEEGEDGEDGENSRLFRLSMTPGCNMVTSGRSQNSKFKDSQGKQVQYLNSGSGMSNPFFDNSRQTSQMQINPPLSQRDQNQLRNQQSTNQQLEINKQEKDGQFEREMLAYQQQMQLSQQQLSYTSNQGKQQIPTMIGSEQCNYDSQLNQIKPQVSNVSPFDLLKNEYIIKKNEVNTKYSNMNSDEEEEEEVEEQECIEEKSNEQEQEQDSLDKSLSIEDKSSIISSPEKIDDTNLDLSKSITHIYKEKLEETQNKSQQQAIQVKNWKLTYLQGLQNKNIDDDMDQTDNLKNETSQESSRTLQQQTQINKFLTLDDFLKKDSSQHLPTNIEKQVTMIDLASNFDKKPTMKEYQSPRLQAALDKTEIQRREKEQEMKKKKEIEVLKQKAKEIENLRNKRINSVIIIQKWVRGHIERIKYEKTQQSFKFMRKLRRILSIAYGKLKTKTLKNLIVILRDIADKNQAEKDDLFQKYIEHCTLTIQKVWRGYWNRKYTIPCLISDYKTQRALCKIVKGWKIRRILKGCREILQIKRNLSATEYKLRKVQSPQDSSIPALMQERTKLILELCKTVPNLYRNGRWIFSQQKLLQGPSRTISSNKKQNLGKFPTQRSGQDKGASYMTGVLQQPIISHHESQYSQTIYFDQQPSMMTIQQPQQQQQWSSNQNKTFTQRLQEQDVTWPSQKSSSQENSNIVWPSHKTENQEQTPRQRPQQTERLEYQENIQVSSRTDNLSDLYTQVKQQQQLQNQSMNVKDYRDQQSRTSKGGKNQSPTKSPYVNKHFQEDDIQINNIPDITTRQSSKNMPLQMNQKKENVLTYNSTEQNEIRGIASSFNEDDRPIQPTKKNPVFKNEEIEEPTTEDNLASQFDEIPIKTVLTEKQYITNDESMISINKKQEYNFEELIEQALLQEGGTKKVKADQRQKQIQRRSKTARMESDEQEGVSDNYAGAKSDKEEKKCNLKKRQKYDPRKAIEESKKVQEGKGSSKSAFPEGMIKKNERRRSVSGKQTVYEEQLNEAISSKQLMNKRNQDEVDEMRNEQEYEQDQDQDLANLANQGAKPYLKRKSRQVLKFDKCAWKGQSRIDCWTKNNDKQADKSQTRRKTSQLRSPKVNLQKEKSEKQQPEININQIKQIKKVMDSKQIAEPQILQMLQNVQQRPVATINLNQLATAKSVMPNQQNTLSFQIPQNTKQSIMHDDTIDLESIPDENDQIQTTDINNFNSNYNSQEQQQLYQLHTQQQIMAQQPLVQWNPNIPQTTNYVLNQLQNQQQHPSETTFSPQQKPAKGLEGMRLSQDGLQENITLHLEELEKIFDIFHPKQQCFSDSEIQETLKMTCIPHMKVQSMFFSCYSDDIYDTILDDLREHYINLCNE